MTASHSSSHSSQEELYLHGRCSVLNLKSVSATTGGQSDFTPPFGGFTQRWPGMPDKTSWPGTDNNGSETGSNAPSQYSDNATICKKEDLPPGNLVPHPYLRNKFYDCKPYVTYKREQNVYMHEDHVFNPYTDDSDFPDNVSCAVQIQWCSGGYCQNGGTCTDTTGGARCICPSIYTGQHSEKELYPCEPDAC